MRRWRVPDGSVLVELTDGTSQHLLRLSSAGQVVQTYAPGTYAHEDDLHQHRFVVQGTQLLRAWSIQGPHGTKTGADVELSGLCVLPWAVSPTADQVRHAIRTHHERAAASEVSCRQQIAVLAMQPAGTPVGSQRQRQRLAERVVRHADGLSSSALSLLNALAALHVVDGLNSHAVAAASTIMDAACAFVTFDPSRLFPQSSSQQAAPLGPPAMSSRAEVQAVLDGLAELSQALLDAADVQELVDAARNAACYRQAAGLAEAARAQLLEAC